MVRRLTQIRAERWTLGESKSTKRFRSRKRRCQNRSQSIYLDVDRGGKSYRTFTYVDIVHISATVASCYRNRTACSIPRLRIPSICYANLSADPHKFSIHFLFSAERQRNRAERKQRRKMMLKWRCWKITVRSMALSNDL